MLHLDDQYKNQLNFKALKRYDSTIVSILYVCSHAALYRIKEGTRDWARKGIEGPLIVFERSVEPRFGLFVLNRLNTVNLSLYFTRDLQYEITDRFVMYRNQDMEVCCLWTYNEADIQALSAVFSRHCKIIGQQPPEQPVPQQYTQSKNSSRIASNKTSRLQNTNHFKNKKAINGVRNKKVYHDSDTAEEASDNQVEVPRSSSRGFRDNSRPREHSYDPSVSLQQYGEFQKPSISKLRYQSMPTYPQSPPHTQEEDLAKKSRELLSLLQGSASLESPKQFTQSPNQLRNDINYNQSIDSKGYAYGDPTPSDLTWILNEFHNFTRNHPHFANDQAINNRNQFARAFGVFLASNDIAANKLHAMYRDMFQ